jgi:SHS family sialic acid transporter-like MFS transporter
MHMSPDLMPTERLAATELTSLPTTRLGAGQWLTLGAALLGWMFDGAEMGLFTAVGRPALQDLLGSAAVDEHNIGQWVSYLTAAFLLGAACGGLVFGWLGDRIGRVRSMAISILVYSIFTGACYFAAQPWQLAALRFAAALGMGGEWALGVALVVECWPERFRTLLAGVIGAAGNLGYLAIALVVAIGRVTPDAWRWTMLVCTAPALLAFIVLAYLPESQRWQRSVRESVARPIREIFTTHLIQPTLLAIGLASVALIGTWGCVQAFLPTWADQMGGQLDPPDPSAKGWTLVAVAVGAICGGFVAPLVGGRIGRRKTYFGMCVASLVVCQALFRVLPEVYNGWFLLMAGIAGFCTASFYGWLPLYLPELFPTRVRATAQGVSFNFGRIFAAAGALGTGSLMGLFDRSYPRACATMSLVYVIGMILIWFGPETRGQPLPE